MGFQFVNDSTFMSEILAPFTASTILLRVAPPKKVQHVQRLQIHLDPPLLARLRLEALRLDISMGEVIRRMLRKEMGA